MRRHRWTLLALLLFAAAAWLMARGEVVLRPAQAAVDFPRALRPAELERKERRKTLPPPAPGTGHVQAPAQPHVADPVLAALPAIPGRSTVVVEANALRHTPLGELLLGCLLDAEGDAGLAELREELGFDPFEDVDRVAFGGEGVLVVSGHFASAKWEAFGPDFATSTSWGERGRVLERHAGGGAMALWGDELLLLGDDPAALRRSLDRLEGRAPVEPAIDEGSTYGEIYGVLAPAQVATLLTQEAGEIREMLLAAVDRIELHVDAAGDVALVVDVEGPDAGAVRDLGKSLGAALAVARLQATRDGQRELAELLELARVVQQGERFSLELALPLALLQGHLADRCGEGRHGATSSASEN